MPKPPETGLQQNYAASYVPDTDSDGLCFADSETAAHFQIKEAEYNGLRIAAVLSDSAF